MSDATTTGRPLDSLFEAIATASISPSDAFAALRPQLLATSDPSLWERTYEALRSLVWGAVAARGGTGQLDQWADVALRVRQLLRVKACPIAERFTVLADMLGQSVRFSSLHPADELRNRKHVGAILGALSERQGTAARTEVAAATSLGDANLSRILANLTSAGWIVRRMEGRSVRVSLTDEGIRQAALLPGRAALDDLGQGTEPFAAAAAASAMSALWAGMGCAVAVADDDAGLLACDAAFASLLCVADPALLLGRSVASIQDALQGAASGPGEIAAPDGRTIRLLKHARGGKTLWLGLDVSEHRKEVEVYRRREKGLLRDIEELTRRRPVHGPSTGSWAWKEGADTSVWPAFDAVKSDILAPLDSICRGMYMLEAVGMSISPAQPVGLGLHSPARAEVLSGIATEAFKLRTLLSDVVRAGDLLSTSAFVRVDVRPTRLITEVLQSLKHTEQVSGVALVMLPFETPDVRTDDRALRVLLLQMIAGLVDVTPTGGTVEIRSECRDDVLVMNIQSEWRGARLHSRWTGSRSFSICDQIIRRYGGEFALHTETHGGAQARVSWPVSITEGEAKKFDFR